MSAVITITDEAAQDAQALFAGMTTAQFKEFLENSILASNSNRMTIDKDVTKQPNGSFKESFTLNFHK